MSVITFPGGVVYKLATDLRARVLDSIEVYKKSRPTYTEWKNGKPHDKSILGLPDVWRIDPPITKGKPQGIQMTPVFQHWIYRINVEWQRGERFTSDLDYKSFLSDELYKFNRKIGGQTIKDYNSLFRSKASHVNRHGVDIRENAITGANKGEGWPIYSNIVTGRWIGKFTVGNGFHVINASKPFTHYNPFDHPWYFDQPLNTGREFIGDTSIIKRDDLRKPYDDFGSNVVMPVMLPVDDFGILPDGKIELPSSGEYLSKRYC